MNRRVLLAGISHETHTFVVGKTALPDFRALRGEDIWSAEGDGSTLAGGLAVARERQWEVIPILHLNATPSGTVDDTVLETFWHAFQQAVAREAAQGIDGIWLDMHGAMVTESFWDAEGEILQRIRTLPACAEIPIGGVLDLHGNFTDAMAENSNGFVVYRENPHADAHQAARDGAMLLDRLMQTGERAVTVRERPPIVWPPPGTGTADEPMRTLETRAREIEATHPEILAINVFAGFAFADTPDTGVSFGAITIGDPIEAQARLRELRDLAIDLRHAGCPHAWTLEEGIRHLARHQEGPVLLVEPADNIGGGAPGDLTIVLQAFVKHDLQNAAVCINDPETVQQLQEAVVGEKSAVIIGGKSGEIGAEPLPLEVEFLSRSDGKYTLEDRHSHAAANGIHHDMGPCAVVRHRGIRILLTSKKTPPFDLAQWRSQGIIPEELSVIAVKAAVAHRQAYNKIAKASYTLDTPGPCTSNLRRLPYRHIQRPIFPLDVL